MHFHHFYSIKSFLVSFITNYFMSPFRKKIYFTVIFSFTLICSSQAQVATVDSKKIMATMPVFSQIDTLVQEETKKYVPDYKMKIEMTKKLIAKADSLITVTKNKKSLDGSHPILSEAQKAQQDFVSYEKKIQKKLEDYRSFILTPYYTKIDTAIKAVATKLKLKQVFDIQTTNFVFLDPGTDITDLVIREMKL